MFVANVLLQPLLARSWRGLGAAFGLSWRRLRCFAPSLGGCGVHFVLPNPNAPCCFRKNSVRMTSRSRLCVCAFLGCVCVSVPGACASDFVGSPGAPPFSGLRLCVCTVLPMALMSTFRCLSFPFRPKSASQRCGAIRLLLWCSVLSKCIE